MQKASGVSQRLEELVELARNSSGASRSNLFASLAQLYERDLSAVTPSELALMREIMRRLVHQVEMSVRMALAERLAEDASAPHDLILLLANDRIEVASLVLERSRAFTEEDLIAIIRQTTPAHQRVVAGRPDVSEPVADALAASTADDVVEILLRNASARISTITFETIADRAKTNPDLPLLNVLATIVALGLVAAGAPLALWLVVHFLPIHYNLLVVVGVWRARDSVAWAQAAIAVWGLFVTFA